MTLSSSHGVCGMLGASASTAGSTWGHDSSVRQAPSGMAEVHAIMMLTIHLRKRLQAVDDVPHGFRDVKVLVDTSLQRWDGSQVASHPLVDGWARQTGGGRKERRIAAMRQSVAACLQLGCKVLKLGFQC